MDINSRYQPLDLIYSAAKANVAGLFSSIAAAVPDRLALCDGDRQFTYRQLNGRSNQWAHLFAGYALLQGDRVAVMLGNCAEYFELELAAAKSGLILAALNWRLSDKELQHCIDLVQPKLVVVSGAMAERLDRLGVASATRVIIAGDCTELLADYPSSFALPALDPEAGLLIMYTSGTTGLPKGALVSHRAIIARAMVFHVLFATPNEDNFVAWTPMYHMVSTDHGLATLLRGGTVWCVDGYQPDRLIELIERIKITWLVLVPGMVGDFVARLQARPFKVAGIKVIGAMADLIPRDEICAATTLLRAPFLNSFGATETGLAPATGGNIAIGLAPDRLPKDQTPFCDLRLVDPDGREVAVGQPGEVSLAGPTLFSGYWNNDDTNRQDFRGGRFHMGDVLRRNIDGSLEYVDRVKYMIKSGGENIYPAEIETVILADTRIETAVVVRKVDAKWGEVPVVFLVCRDEAVSEAEVVALCRGSLASYKMPKQICFIKDEDLPRSTTGKIQRHLLEKLI
ncbi:fatty-acyl-CoA synthase [Zhongshania antarctica]|uniref:Fatty-acyl-CoA synthase n=1 Tax=Zhongshania antarctica TaxID=641702 RepID=A0A840R3Y0_9GAMM|nr:class I adenylate-forming enzyme family protein [Zhongshania antarctica]MBB5187855.1 fatty-acyl-CoA synthase [Zhongshania antarctica]